MGMFDSVYVSCPNCGVVVELQSKAGKCELKRYKMVEAPAQLLLDLADRNETCSHCGKSFYLRVQVITHAVTVSGTVPEED